MFQSTPSAREGDLFRSRARYWSYVSIHAFREGRRLSVRNTKPRWRKVSIHAFREGRRPDGSFGRVYGRSFQSTPSAREGDATICKLCLSIPVFQSTPSAREGDVYRFVRSVRWNCFNPRLPRGKATRYRRNITARILVSIHAFREGRRHYRECPSNQRHCFNPRLPRGKATLAASRYVTA